MMTVRIGAALAGAAVVFGACTSGGGSEAFESASLETDDQKASYAIGLSTGNQLAETRDRLDRAAFFRGVETGLQGDEPVIPQGELQRAVEVFSREIQEATLAEQARLGRENGEAGDAYRAENGSREGVTTTESGLQYEVLRAGEGARAESGDNVRLHYRGTFVDGNEFDSSYDGDPVVFSTAPGGLIDGFTEALLLMPEGSHYRIALPPAIAYGPMGSGSIPPNSTLIFEIELFEVVQ